MNNVRSFWIGWGALCVGGGGAYYFAKKRIDADRREKLAGQARKRQEMAQLEAQHEAGGAGPPAQNSKAPEKSKYEAATPFISPKGDRFS